MQILKINKADFSAVVKEAAGLIKRGKVLICPSDTVYGLVCDAANSKAVARIFKIKKRSRSKPIALFVKNVRQAKSAAWINGKQEKILRKFWPGKLTAVLKSKKPLAGVVFKGAIGLRVPDCEFLLELLDRVGRPLAQTSANISGMAPAIKAKEAIKQFSNKLEQPDLVLDIGGLAPSVPSTVIDLTGEKIIVLRKGAVSF